MFFQNFICASFSFLLCYKQTNQITNLLREVSYLKGTEEGCIIVLIFELISYLV